MNMLKFQVVYLRQFVEYLRPNNILLYHIIYSLEGGCAQGEPGGVPGASGTKGFRSSTSRRHYRSREVRLESKQTRGENSPPQWILGGPEQVKKIQKNIDSFLFAPAGDQTVTTVTKR